MDFDWSLHNDSYLEAVRKVLVERKAFLNLDGNQYHVLLLNIILALKCVVSGYGMVKIVPMSVTYIFLILYASVQCFLENWFNFEGDMLHALAHSAVLIWLHDAEEFLPSVPNMMIWYFYSLYQGAEFFLDCYVVMTILSFIWKSYTRKPHRLSLIICLCFSANWIGDTYIYEGPSGYKLILLYYLPVILFEAFNTTDEYSSIPDSYVSLWLICKLARLQHKIFLAKMRNETVEMDNKEINFTYILEEFSKRETFLNVDENEHYVVFHLILLLKSIMAAYAVKHVMSFVTSLKVLVVNCIFTLLDRNVRKAIAGLFYFLVIAGYQYVFFMQQYHTPMHSVIWYFVSWDEQFQFFLDVFLVASVAIYIDEAYQSELDKISSLLCFLYSVDWLSDTLSTGEPLGKITTAAIFYTPGLLISANAAMTRRCRILSLVGFASLWIIFRLEKEYFEHFVNEYYKNSYEISEFFTHLTDVFYH